MNLDVAVAPREDLGLPEGSIDLAVVYDSYRFVAERSDLKPGFFRSLRSALKPGGVVVVGAIKARHLKSAVYRDRWFESVLEDFAAHGFVPGPRRLFVEDIRPAQIAEFMRPALTPEELRMSVDRWHENRLAELKSKDGWLTLVGLAWLDEGTNEVGSAPGRRVACDGLPADAGVFEVKDDAVTFRAADGVSVSGAPADGRVQSDADGSPTVLGIGNVRLHVIRRGDRLGVRMKDDTAPLRTRFEGIERYPVDPAWRIEATLEPVAGAETTPVELIIGTVVEEPVAAWAVFEHAGNQCRIMLSPGGGPGRFFVVFGDTTNGASTYGGGRFIEAVRTPDGDRVVLDFNRAYNPPCAFTPYATCPLPVESNRLPFAVEAGEMKWDVRRTHPTPPAGG